MSSKSARFFLRNPLLRVLRLSMLIVEASYDILG